MYNHLILNDAKYADLSKILNEVNLGGFLNRFRGVCVTVLKKEKIHLQRGILRRRFLVLDWSAASSC